MCQESECFLIEKWKLVDDKYKTKYEISNTGKVRNFITKKELKQQHDIRGYATVTLGCGKYKKTVKVHRLVALAFIPNPNHYPQVNHKDENKKNNYECNLEWCTNYYNSQYGKHKQNISTSLKQKVKCIETNIVYDSMLDTELITGIKRTSISACCSGKRKTAGGYHWAKV